MNYELKSARFLAAETLRKALGPGDTAVDATMGNGHDTELLCHLVGPEGHVFGFDIQPEAVAATEKRLAEADLASRATLYCESHDHLAERVPGPVDAVVFNLGWLPGGDHRITTRVESTRAAIEQALYLLRAGGILVVCVYPGHPEGAREQAMLDQLFADLSPRDFNVLRQTFLNAGAGAPACYVAQRQPDRN